MLARLANQYNTARNIATAARLKEAFSQETIKEKDSIGSFTAPLIKYRTELAHTHHAITDNDMTTKLLASLPEGWQTIKEFIYNSGEFTWNNAVSILLQNEDVVNPKPMSIGTSQNNNDRALPAKEVDNPASSRGQRGRGRGRDNRRTTTRSNTAAGDSIIKKCFYCTKPGYIVRDCTLKTAANKLKKDWKDRDKASAATAAGTGGCESALVAMAGSIIPLEYKDDFYPDSGCTVHLTN